MDTWVESLRSTGGTLVPEKCNWFKLRFHWENDKWIITSFNASDPNPHLTMLNDIGERESINQLHAGASLLALGVQFSPSGQMVDQCKLLKEKASTWAEHVRYGKLQKCEAWQALVTTVSKTMEYPLPATTLSLRECDEIVSPILQIGLPRSGICRNISRQVAFSSVQYKGLGLKHPRVLQGIYKLLLLVDAPNGITHKPIECSLALYAYECGLGSNFVLRKFEDYKSCITLGWVTSLWAFLSYYKVTLYCTKEPKMYTEGRIMYHINKVAKNQQRIFNHCRLYLKLEFDGELFTSDQNQIRKSVWDGIIDIPMILNSVINHPVTPRPSPRAWKIWRTWLIKIWGQTSYYVHTTSKQHQPRYLEMVL